MHTVSIQSDNMVEAVLNAAQPLVLFRCGTMVMAAPLAQAYRFDEIDYVAGATRASYLDDSLPLHAIDKPETGRKSVIVFGPEGGLEGLVVDEILDIVAYNGFIPQTSQPSYGAVMVRGRVTEIVNLDWFRGQEARAA